MVGNAAGDRAHDVQHIERRHARPSPTDIEPWIREPETLGGSADGEAQQETLRLRTILLQDESGIERLAHLAIEQHGIFARLLRKQPLGQTGNEDDAKRTTARLMWAPDEDLSISAGGRMFVESAQAYAQHVAHFLERDRSNGGHRAQLAENAKHAHRVHQHARRERVETVQPLSPGGLLGPGGEDVDHRQGERRQMAKVVLIAAQAGEPRRLRVFAFLCTNQTFVLLCEPGQASFPPCGVAADDRGFHDQALPHPRRSQHSRHHRRPGLVVQL